MSSPWILISILALIIIFIVIFFVRKDKKRKKLTSLTSLAFVFILAGIFSISIFEGNRLITYSLFGIAVLLAVLDIFIKRKK